MKEERPTPTATAGDAASVADAPARGLAGAALALLRENDTGAFVKPARHQYPHQWNWDAAFIAIGLRHVDPALARRELRALLAAQWRNGMVPHIVYHGGASDYFPTPEFWRTAEAAQSGAVASSGLTHPPVLATAVRLLHDAAPDGEALDFVRRCYPKLLAFHRWLRQARDPDGTGLVAIVHPWESGTDDSTRWTAPLAAITDPSPPPYTRRDRRYVRAAERPHEADYARFMHLIGLFRDWGWDDEALYRRSPFLVQDVLFNAILHRADADLAELARRIGEPSGEIEGWRARTLEAFAGRWDGASGLFLDLDARSGAPLRASTWTCFSPLYGGLPDAEQEKRLVAEQLLNPARYAPGELSRYALPSVAMDDPHFEPRRYWRGPVWINVNWLLSRGLRARGYHTLAGTLAQHALELTRAAGFVEYYDPRDGTACGASDFSWSAALALDLLHDPDGT